MVTREVLFTEDAHAQMDDLLWRVCDELQLSPTRYEQAVARYEAAAEWLDGEGSALSAYFPTIYPQGSMRLGTTVKPFGREEHDLDFVCEFQTPSSSFESPLQLIRMIESRFRQHQTYASILEIKNRCVRLNYANEFHLDILPACPDPRSGDSCLVVPDRESKCWKPSNPKGYAKWFEERCELALGFQDRLLLERADPVPPQQKTTEKETLKRAVQLLKRWRDIRYRHTRELAPISMVLTTLAANAYAGQVSLAEAMDGILTGVLSIIGRFSPRIHVLNPANPQEDLSERWDNLATYHAFAEGIRELHIEWKKVLASRGIQNTSQLLENLFGSPVQMAVTKQARLLQEMREKSMLRVGAAGLITGSPIARIPMRSNTFHGEE
jgi:hypothetical protein